MARLHEYQGKAILAANGFKIPRGRAAWTADQAIAIAKELAAGKKAAEVVVKIQAWTTGRAGIGGVAFAKKPAHVRGHAARMLGMKVGQFPVEAVLVEEKIDIDREFFLSFAIDDAARAVKTDQTFGILGRCRRELREVKCAAMIALLDRVSDALKRCRRMIELTRNLDFQFRVPRDGVIINRDAAIGGDELAIFRQHERIDFNRAGFDTARRKK